MKRVREHCAGEADQERVSAAREVPYPAVERPVQSLLVTRICTSVAANLYRSATAPAGGRYIQPRFQRPNASLRWATLPVRPTPPGEMLIRREFRHDAAGAGSKPTQLDATPETTIQSLSAVADSKRT